MADSDLDPQAFLKTVRDLSDKRQREDNERYEKLEAQILQDRTARLERKMERERSLSPEKTPQSMHSPGVRTPLDTGSPNSSLPASPIRELPIRELSREDSVRSFRSDRASSDFVDRPASPTKPASPSAAMPSRANTMSWQRRPQSGTRSRPLSILAAENASRASTEALTDSRPTSRDEPTQQDISRSLSTKDPSWFRQTPDRGLGSTAYRRSRDEEDARPGSDKRQLPGLVNSRTEPTRQSDSLARGGLTTPTRSSFQRELSPPSEEVAQHVITGAPPTPLREPVPEVERAAFGRTVPGLQDRGSITERPTSPTKGMGGFVQSAMMKRTDSVSKRWSNQPTGFGRADSTASLRSGFGSIRNGLAESNSMPRLGQSSSSQEPTSRPGSSHGMMAGQSNLAISSSDACEKPTRQAGSMHSRSKSHASLRDNSSQSSELPPTFSPPLSPSKRWSPSKSSWLESALARPESPTKQMASPSTQPSWMTDLNKAKQQRSSVATNFSHDGVVMDMGVALVQSFQAVKASTANLEASASKPASHEDATEKKRTFTPPTKAKPPALAGKPSKEKLILSSKPEVSQRSQVDAASSSPQQPSTPKREEIVTMVPTPSSKLSVQAGILDKPKPATPPKIDFRSALKPRPTSEDQSRSEEPEFRNALGKLKRTTTQNYVAPDVLKNNILRGKAGLAVTDGPQKTVKRDEFKESIIAKKSEMKAKTPELVAKPFQKPLVQAPTPEALEVKKGLQRSSSSNLSTGTPNARRDITPEALAKHKSLRGKPLRPGENPSKLSEKPAIAPYQTSKAPLVESNEVEAVEPIKLTTTNESDEPLKIPENTETRSNAKAKPASFGDRFNPALAGLLARGPPPQSSAPRSVASTAGDADGTRSVAPLKTTNVAEESKGGELTHMTKGRARGPKRRKPQSSSHVEETPKPKISTAKSTIALPKRSEGTEQPQVTSSREPVQPRPKSNAVRTLSTTLSDKVATKEKPPTPTKSSSLPIRTSNTFSTLSNSSHAPLQPVLGSPLMMEEKPKIDTVKQNLGSTVSDLDGTHGKHVSKSDEDKENSAELPSVKNAAARWGASNTPKANTSRNTPITLPSREDEEAALRSAGLLSSSPLRYRASKPDGLGISTSAAESPNTVRFPLSPPSSGGAPPKPGKSSRVVSQTLGGSAGVQDGSHIKTPKATAHPVSEAAKLLESFFGSVPNISTRLEIDAQTALTVESSAPGRTLRKSIQLLTQNGKLTPLPTDKEYILFSSALYIITHVFGSNSGQRQTEVFLWVGKDVNGAAVEDSQLFAKRVAKEAANGSRSPPPVIVVKQSREPASFFQALGGITITRKGSHADTATKPYILCGRPHLGHIAFDEVDITVDTLAPAFPYIIVNPVTIQDTQAYLWKGSSCEPEAVGSARLISMDLSSRDVIEVTPGSEPQSLLTLLPSKRFTQSTSFPSITERSPPRLFRIDVSPPRRSSSTFFGFFNRRPSSPNLAARPTSSASNRSLTSPSADEDPLTALTEISPFGQEDFEPEHIFLLDVGSTVLIIPGPLLSTTATQLVKPKDTSGVETKMWEHLFAQACLLGSDYAMLAAGLQDRQKVPDVKICLGGLSADVEMCFRDWDESRGLWGAAGLMAGRRSTGGGVKETQMIDVGEVLDCCAR